MLSTEEKVSTLQKVRSLLSESGRWIKNDFSQNKNYEPVPCNSPDAYFFCLIGGVGNVLNVERDDTTVFEVVRELFNKDLLVFNKAISFNDRAKNVSEVIELIDNTIKRLEREANG